MTEFPRVTVLDGGSGGPALRAVITERGYRLADDEGGPAGVTVARSTAALPAGAVDAVRRGAGLVVLAASGSPAPHASVTDLLAMAGIAAAGEPEPAATVAAEPRRIETESGTAADLLARVDPGVLRATGTWDIHVPAAALLRTADRGSVVLAAVSTLGAGRVVVIGVDGPRESTGELLLNAVAFASPEHRRRSAVAASGTATEPAWLRLKRAVTGLQAMQDHDGAVPSADDRQAARAAVEEIVSSITELSPRFAHDSDYLAALTKDFARWADGGFGVPDFLDSLQAFHPEHERVDGREHLVVFPMYTQNGSPDRHVEAVLVQVIWPDFVADLEASGYSNKLFVPIRFLDFTAGYDTNSAVLFPETVAMREVPKFTWGAIFADREAARFRRVVSAAAEITGLPLPPDAARLLADQQLAEETFVMWDLIHDRTHMHGDLPFDPFMIKQRMPYFLYSLEELRCDLTAFAESVRLERSGNAHARLVQYAVVFDRIFRFAITGTRVRNYDGLGGQLLFAWLHQRRVLHWTDNRLTIDWSGVTPAVLELGRQIEELYWRSIDRPKTAHWLAAYQLVSGTVEPHPASTWKKGVDALPVDGPPKGLTDAVLPDEFPLSMFYEALSRKLSPVVTATAGITGR